MDDHDIVSRTALTVRRGCHVNGKAQLARRYGRRNLIGSAPSRTNGRLGSQEHVRLARNRPSDPRRESIPSREPREASKPPTRRKLLEPQAAAHLQRSEMAEQYRRPGHETPSMSLRRGSCGLRSEAGRHSTLPPLRQDGAALARLGQYSTARPKRVESPVKTKRNRQTSHRPSMLSSPPSQRASSLGSNGHSEPASAAFPSRQTALPSSDGTSRSDPNRISATPDKSSPRL